MLWPLLRSCNFVNACVFSYTVHLLSWPLSTQNFDLIFANFCAIVFRLINESVLTDTSLLNLPIHSSISSTLSELSNVIFSKLIDFTLKNAPTAALAV